MGKTLLKAFKWSWVLLLFQFQITKAQTTLAQGDLSIIGFNANAPDGFTFVTWVTLAPNTVIKFTDNGFNGSGNGNGGSNASGNYREQEQIVIWTNNTGTSLAPGTVITIQANSTTAPTATVTNIGTITSVTNSSNGTTATNMTLTNTSGDQIFAFQGSGGPVTGSLTSTFSGTLICAMGYSGSTNTATGWVTSGTINASTSYLPSELFVNSQIFLGPNIVGGQYTGPTSGQASLAAYKALVADPSNWTKVGSGTVTLPMPAASDGATFTAATPVVVNSVTSSTANGVYKVGDVISIQVNFSAVVNVNTGGGTPTLTLETGTTDRTINYTSGTGTSSLTFSYTAQAGDANADLDYVSTSALALNGATIKDAANNNAVLTLPSPGAAGSLGANKAIVIDTQAPTTTISSLSFSNDTGASNTDFITNVAAQTISGTLSANLASDEKVMVSIDNGATYTAATINVGSTTWSLAGVTLSGSNTLIVVVQDLAGNRSIPRSQAYTLDTQAPTTTISSLSFSNDSGTSSTDFVTNVAAQTISGTLSANLAPGETVYVSTNNGTTYTAATINVGSTAWSLAGVTLIGSNTLKVVVEDLAGNRGTVRVQAYTLDTTAPTNTIASITFSNDTGTSSTDFVTKTAAQTVGGTLSTNLASGEFVMLSLDNGASTSTLGATGNNIWNRSGVTLTGSNTLKVYVQDLAGNIGPVRTQDYVLDTTSPTVDVTSSSTILKAYETATIAFTFNEPISGFTMGGITATNGTLSNFTATANPLVYTIAFTPTAGLNNASGKVSVTAGSYEDIAGNSGAGGNSPNIAIDTQVPTVTSVSVPSNGTYKIGDNLDFTVNFSENVNVTNNCGSPTLAITLATGTVYAHYFAGSGTASLIFRVEVQAGNEDNNGIALGALTLNGGSIMDAAYNYADLTLNNVATTAGVKVDGIAPTLTITSTAGASGATTATTPIPFTITFSENVSNFVLADLGVTNGTASGFSGSGATYTFNVTPASTGNVTVNVAANVATDAAGNGNTAGTPFVLDYQGTLPVNLLTFNAKAENNAVKLQWQTASEQNNKGFEIWRKAEGEKVEGPGFVKIGEVQASQISNLTSQIYSFTDKNPLNGNNYYKLVQVDMDGTATELGVRTVNFGLLTSDILLSPNPTTNRATLTYDAGRYTKIILVDINGKVIKQLAIAKADSSTVVDVSALPGGTYIFRLTGSSSSAHIKMIKQ